jgi:hypothetical protein
MINSIINILQANIRWIDNSQNSDLKEAKDLIIEDLRTLIYLKP